MATTTCPNGRHWIDWSDAQTGACSACLFEETGGQRRSDEEFDAVYGDGR